MPGRPSWQLLTSAANPGKLPARDRGEQQRKSETGFKVGVPNRLPRVPINFSLQQTQPRRPMPGPWTRWSWSLLLRMISLSAGAGAAWCTMPSLPQPRGEAAGVSGLDSRLTPSPDWGTLGDGADAASRPVLAPCSLQRKQRKEGSWALRAQAGRTVLAALLSFLLRSTRRWVTPIIIEVQ